MPTTSVKKWGRYKSEQSFRSAARSAKAKAMRQDAYALMRQPRIQARALANMVSLKRSITTLSGVAVADTTYTETELLGKIIVGAEDSSRIGNDISCQRLDVSLTVESPAEVLDAHVYTEFRIVVAWFRKTNGSSSFLGTYGDCHSCLDPTAIPGLVKILYDHVFCLNAEMMTSLNFVKTATVRRFSIPLHGERVKFVGNGVDTNDKQLVISFLSSAPAMTVLPHVYGGAAEITYTG